VIIVHKFAYLVVSTESPCGQCGAKFFRASLSAAAAAAAAHSDLRAAQLLLWSSCSYPRSLEQILAYEAKYEPIHSDMTDSNVIRNAVISVVKKIRRLVYRGHVRVITQPQVLRLLMTIPAGYIAIVYSRYIHLYITSVYLVYRLQTTEITDSWNDILYIPGNVIQEPVVNSQVAI
jgi:hypothetical protein